MGVLCVLRRWPLVGLAVSTVAVGPQCVVGEGRTGANGDSLAECAVELPFHFIGPPVSPITNGHRVDLEKSNGADDELVDGCVQAAMDRVGAPGAAVAVMVDGALVYEQGYGMKERGGDEPVNPRTVFRIGSITKMMTAAAVMQQVDLGRVTLEDPVTLWIPDFEIRDPWRPDQITVRHLLTHTSGLPDLPFAIDGRTDDDALGDWASLLGAVELNAAPGSFWNYSNPNYMLAGLVAERASGIEYHELMRSSVWGPAGLEATTLIPDEVLAGGDWAWGHYTNPVTNQEGKLAPDDYDRWAAAPAGYAFSTARDLVRWAELLMQGGSPVLSSSSAALMQSEVQWTHYTTTEHYGFGVFSDTYNGVSIKHHGGNIPGWGSFLLWVPERLFAVAVLNNTFESIPDAALCIADVVLDLEDVPPADDTTDPQTWGPFAGLYDVRDAYGRSWTASVVLQGEDLDLELTPSWMPQGAIHSDLVQVLATTFLADIDDDGTFETDFTFIDPPGEPTQVRFMRNRQMVGGRSTLPKPVGNRAGP